MNFSFNIIPPDQFKTVLWKNGLGTTKEIIVKYLPEHKNYIWRVSIAGVVNNGPFSNFKGYDRILMMLEGNGINMKHSDGRVNSLYNVSDIVCFSGDLDTTAELINGKIMDFNIMVFRDKCFAKVDYISSKKDIEYDYDELLIYSHEKGSEIEIDNTKLHLPKQNLLHIYGSKLKTIKLHSLNAIIAKINYIE